MAKKSRKTGSRHAKIPEGWEGQGLQIPKQLRAELREAAGDYGMGGIKVIGTAAIAIVMALDPEDRHTLCEYVRQKTYKSPEGLEKGRVLALLELLLNEGDSKTARVIQPRWVVDEPES